MIFCGRIQIQHLLKLNRETKVNYKLFKVFQIQHLLKLNNNY